MSEGRVAAHQGVAQQRVRATIGRLGGYWRPLAATARLLEELGELAACERDAAEREDSFSGATALASELADLWIITTALADQFLADVAEPGLTERVAGMDIGGLVSAAGVIARVVNYYDGPKVPRDLGALPSLAAAVADFHGKLAACAHAREIDLGLAVDQKLDAIAARDGRRFARSCSDPSTEPCVEEFRSLHVNRPGWDSASARLWGARISSFAEAGDSLAELLRSLRSFARAAPHEHLDGYVIAGPEMHTAEESSTWREQLLDWLCSLDPDQHALEGAGCEDRLFSLESLNMIVAVFSPHSLLDGADRPSKRPFALLRPGPA